LLDRDDDARAIRIVVPHELKRIEEEEEDLITKEKQQREQPEEDEDQEGGGVGWSLGNIARLSS
jgi:hypothetical protein